MYIENNKIKFDYQIVIMFLKVFLNLCFLSKFFKGISENRQRNIILNNLIDPATCAINRKNMERSDLLRSNVKC